MVQITRATKEERSCPAFVHIAPKKSAVKFFTYAMRVDFENVRYTYYFDGVDISGAPDQFRKWCAELFVTAIAKSSCLGQVEGFIRQNVVNPQTLLPIGHLYCEYINEEGQK